MLSYSWKKNGAPLYTMEKFDAIIAAGQLADMANTRQATDVAAYYISPVVSQPKNIPTMSYGLQITRQVDAPPSDLIDVESRLKNQYDLIGKSGYVHNTKTTPPPPPPPEQPQLTNKTPTPESFFETVAGRDFNQFSRSCGNLNIWRDDVIVDRPNNPAITTRFGHVDTRMMTKDKLQAC